MKKSLLAVAAMGAFASAAQAQSSVTVYGILDVGYKGVTATTPYGTSAPPAGTPSNNKTIVNELGDGAETSSRLGFKGVEDLGGGSSAFFTVEMGLTPTGATVPAAGGLTLNNRQSFVGLKKNGIGQASIGTQYTALWLNALAPTDPGASNNVVGSVIRPLGVSGSLEAQANGTAVTSLTTNSLYLESARFAGFRVAGNYVAKAGDATQRISGPSTTSTSNGGQNNFTGFSISADYTWQKLLVAAGYSSFKQDQGTTAFAATATGLGASPATNNSTVNTNDTQYFVGATYDFGILKAYANYVNRKVENSLSTSTFASRAGQQLGVRSYITPTVEAWASAGNGQFRQFGASEPTSNFIAYQIGANYYLSKRTNLYAIAGQSNSSGVAGSAVYGANGGSKIAGYALGLRHTF